MSSNGNLTASELQTIPWDHNFRVSVDIFANVLAFGEAFKARFGAYPAIESAYRSYSEQAYLYKLYGYPRSVPPGTSNHGLGRAVDWKSNINTYRSAEWAFMNTQGRKFGFTPLNSNNLTFEPWHWQDLISTVSNPGFNLPPIPVVPDLPPITPLEAIVTPEQLKSILDAIAGLDRRFTNVEGIIAVDTFMGNDGGIRGEVQRIRPDLNTVATIVRELATDLGHPSQN